MLLVLVKKQPPAGRKLLVIGTSSAGEVLDSMGLSGAFNVQLHVPALKASEVEKVMQAAKSFAPQDLPQVRVVCIFLVPISNPAIRPAPYFRSGQQQVHVVLGC